MLVIGRLRFAAVVGRRHEARVEDLLVDVGLEQVVNACGFAGDIVGGHELGLDRDTELVGRVAGQTKTLRVVCNKFDSHGAGLELLVSVGMKDPLKISPERVE